MNVGATAIYKKKKNIDIFRLPIGVWWKLKT
jgi:hypothetical protein